MKRFVLFFCLMTICSAAARAEIGVGAGITPEDFSSSSEIKKPRPKDPYVEAIANRFNLTALEIQKLWNRGYGRNELIKAILISRKAGRELKEVIEQRDKNVKLRDIAAKYGLDYHPIFLEAGKIRKELDYRVAISTSTANSQETTDGKR